MSGGPLLAVLRRARALDQALQRRFGRPYNALLGTALVLEIAEQVHHVIEAPQQAAGLLRAALVTLVAALLLLNQLAELAERVEQRRAKRR
jgi:hypothetical protein